MKLMILTPQEPRGFAYVQFEDMRDAEACIVEMEDFKLKGRDLDVRLPKEIVKIQVRNSELCNFFIY